MIHSCCRNCKNRKLGCHSICQEYIAYKQKLEEEKQLYMQGKYTKDLNLYLKEQYFKRRRGL